MPLSYKPSLGVEILPLDTKDHVTPYLLMICRWFISFSIASRQKVVLVAQLRGVESQTYESACGIERFSA